MTGVQTCALPISKFAFNPPLNFLVCYDKETSWTRGNDGHDAGEIDAAIVATHMMLAAKSVGLGTTWVGSFNPKDVKEQFNLPENYVPVAFLPTGVLGFLLYKHIKALFVPETVAFMLIIGGLVFIAIEYFYKNKEHSVHSIDTISYKQALLIGFAQSLSMVPGTSRSGATIIGGLLSGLDRKTAVEFSFLLAVPTMIIATGYDIVKTSRHLTPLTYQIWRSVLLAHLSLRLSLSNGF